MKKPLLYTLLSLCLSSQLFIACKNQQEEVIPQKEEVIPTDQPGYFVISSDVYTSSIPNARIAGTNIDTQFDLGALKASEEFVFMIANGGGEPIFDITLTSDNSPFDVSPKSIQVLPGKNQGSIIPLLTIGVTHGVRLNGIGTAPNLQKGENKAIIRMKGKTLSSKDKVGNFLVRKDTIEVIGEFIVKVDAKVIDAKILSGGIEAVTGVVEYIITPHLIVEPAKTVKMVNTGNITVEATISYNKFITEPNPISATGVSTEYIVMSNKITLMPDQEIDISNLISPKRGEHAEGKLTIIYEGQTNIGIDIQGNVYNVNYFQLISQ